MKPDCCVARLRDARTGGKEVQPLRDHLRETARLAGEFAAKAGLPLAGFLLGLLHDFGKYSGEFQNYILSARGCLAPGAPGYVDAARRKGKVDHSTAGAQHLWRFFKAYPKCRPMVRMLALCLVSHHSGLIDSISPEEKDVLATRMDKDERQTHLEECLLRCDPPIAEELGKLLHPKVMKECHDIWRGLQARLRAQLPEGAGETEQGQNANSCEFQMGLLARFLLSCLLDADRISSAEFADQDWKEQRARLPRRPWAQLLGRLEAELAAKEQEFAHAIDGLRREVSEQCARAAGDGQGLFTLTVPTGGGKTLASLRFALGHALKHDLDRIIYIIPYTSIIDQNAQTARSILEQDEAPGSIVLEHHSNIVPPEERVSRPKGPEGGALADEAAGCEDELTAGDWEKLAENWEAPVVFTTMVQFLESLFGSGTTPARRMHNLARSVLIFDEIQTLPIKCMYMYCNAIDFLIHSCGATVLLCTATQPRFGNVPEPQKGRLPSGREIVLNVPKLFGRLRRTDFFDHCRKKMSLAQVADLALAELALTGSCLVVCNTRRQAETVYALCRRQWQGKSYYLSTRLCPAHRLKKLADMTAALNPPDGEPEPVLCVSTQLIECGVDISFASVIRFAAGLDSILQAAGRCNRHGLPTPGRVHIVLVEEAEEKLGAHLDAIKAGQDVFLGPIRVGLAKVLEASDNDFSQPDLIDAYFDHYFYRRGTLMDYTLKKKQSPTGDSLLNMLGRNTHAARQSRDPTLRQSFASANRLFQAIDAPARAVIAPYGEGESIIADLCSASMLHERKNLLRRAQRYSVNVFEHELAALAAAGALHDIQGSGILALTNPFYCQELGIMAEGRAGQRAEIL